MLAVRAILGGAESILLCMAEGRVDEGMGMKGCVYGDFVKLANTGMKIMMK